LLPWVGQRCGGDRELMLISSVPAVNTEQAKTRWTGAPNSNPDR
jgi:hypothetical protein